MVCKPVQRSFSLCALAAATAMPSTTRPGTLKPSRRWAGVMAAAAATLTPVTLELGGKDALTKP